MNTLIAYDKDDAERYVHDLPQADRLFPFTPDALSILKQYSKLPLLLHREQFTDYSHLRVMANTRKIERKIYQYVNRSNVFKKAEKETFLNIFHVAVNSTLFLWYSLKGSGPWIIFDCEKDKWVNTPHQSDAFKILFINIVKKKAGIFGLSKIENQKFKSVFHLINYLTLKFISGNVIWTTGPAYGMHKISEQIQKKYPRTKMLYLKPGVVSTFKDFLKTLMNPIRPFRKNNIDIPIIPIRKKTNSSFIAVQKIVDEADDPVINFVLEPFSNFLSTCIDRTEALKPYVKKLFIIKPPQLFLAWHLRWLDVTVLGEIAKYNKVDSILISHGTHTFPNDSSAVLMHALESLANGLLVSPLASKTIVQSRSAYRSAKIFMPRLKRIKSQPMMWGSLNILTSKKSKITNDFVILHAGTYKPLGLRPWIFETSNEFVYGLHQLICTIKKIDNIRLIIRIREDEECSLITLNNLLPKASNCTIKTGGSFKDDLDIADMLISYSSTAIEEALYARKPIALFGGSSRYRHFVGSTTPPTNNQRSAVYHLDNENLPSMIKSIMHKHSNKSLTDQEVGKYIWPNSIPGSNKFISKLF